MLILAPMQGLTELLFRRAYEQVFPHALDVAVSPFISLTHGSLKDALKKISDVLPENNLGSIPVIPQILGRETQEFVELANRLYDLGYDEVNWNIGCPMRRVAAKHRGSGILPYPDEVEEVLNAVVPNLKPQLSVKMRLGYYKCDEIFELIPILNDIPLKNVTIHPRIGKQIYSGVPDMDTFSQVLPLIKHPVIYNGDVCTAEGFNVIRSRFPQIEDIMIGRGILYDPLLPLKIKGITANKDKGREFIQVLIEAIVNRPITVQAKIRKIKEYWCLLYKSLGITEQQRYKVLHSTSLEDTLDEVRRCIKDNTLQ